MVLCFLSKRTENLSFKRFKRCVREVNVPNLMNAQGVLIHNTIVIFGLGTHSRVMTNKLITIKSYNGKL